MVESVERNQYDGFAKKYKAIENTPHEILAAQLVAAAMDTIGIQGKTVLDFGGGSGTYARKAIEKGATQVDLLDVSAEMVKVAENTEKELGRRDAMRFYVADANADLSKLDLRPQYDIVMVNWLLDYATSDEDLEAFWRNIASLTKPGGIYFGLRTGNPWSSAITKTSKYGFQCQDFREVPGGVSYQVYIFVEDPIDFRSTSMEKMYSGSTVMHERHGFQDVHHIDPADTAVVKQNPDFWQMFLDDPIFYCDIAKKKV